MGGPRNDVTLVKEINTDMIKSALKRMGRATKAQISDATGISVATCGKILNELRVTGEVNETSQAQADYGRPAKSYSYNATFSLVACLYVHTDSNQLLISTVVADLLGDTLEESIEESTVVNYEALKRRIRGLRDLYPAITVVSVGVPGYMNDGVVDLSNFPDLNGLALGAMLSADFPGIRILVENDSNAAAYGYYRTSGRDEDCSVAFLFSPDRMVSGSGGAPVPDGNGDKPAPVFNLGAGIVSGGRILRGFSGFAGEVMHLPVNRAGYDADRSVENYIRLLSDVATTIIAIVNPRVLAMAGGFIRPEILEAVRTRCGSVIPAHHMPEIVLRKNIHNDYVTGLIAIALDTLSCNVRLIYRHA